MKTNSNMGSAFCDICKKITDGAQHKSPTLDILCDCLYMLGDMVYCYRVTLGDAESAVVRHTFIVPPVGGHVNLNGHHWRISEAIARVFGVEISYNKEETGRRVWHVTGSYVDSHVAGYVLELLLKRWRCMGDAYRNKQDGSKEERRAKKEAYFSLFVESIEQALGKGINGGASQK